MIIPAAALAILVMPAFWLVAHHPTPTTLYAASILLAGMLDLSTCTMLVAVAEELPRARRAGGFALIYAVAISAFGGSTQFAVARLIRLTGNRLTPAWYMLAALVVGLVGMWRFPETRPELLALEGGGSVSMRSPSAQRRGKRSDQSENR